MALSNLRKRGAVCESGPRRGGLGAVRKTLGGAQTHVQTWQATR